MKRQILAAALGSVFALPALANNEIDSGYTGPAQKSTPIAPVLADAELGTKGNQP